MAEGRTRAWPAKSLVFARGGNSRQTYRPHSRLLYPAPIAPGGTSEGHQPERRARRRPFGREMVILLGDEPSRKGGDVTATGRHLAWCRTRPGQGNRRMQPPTILSPYSPVQSLRAKRLQHANRKPAGRAAGRSHIHISNARPSGRPLFHPEAHVVQGTAQDFGEQGDHARPGADARAGTRRCVRCCLRLTPAGDGHTLCIMIVRETTHTRHHDLLILCARIGYSPHAR